MEISDDNSHCLRRRRSMTRKDGALRKGRRDHGSACANATPPVKWLLRLRGAELEPPMTGGGWSGRVADRRQHGRSVSARKLVAGLWHLEAPTNSSNPGGADGMTWHWRRSRFGRLLFEVNL